jgi:putative DNA primase/helicase
MPKPKKSFGAGGVVVIRGEGEIVLACEGPEDALSLAVAMPEAAVICTAGAGTLYRVAAHLPPNAKRVVLVADRDAAGRDGTEKAAAAVHKAGVPVAIALPPEGTKDANDVLRTQGVEALKIMLEGAVPFAAAGDSTNASDAQDTRGNGSILELISAAAIIPRPIHWLWNGWLAQGKLHILAGSPGTGKTTIALAMAATISVGGRWPDGSIAAKGDVLIWSGEDDPTDALVPRLLASGADPSRVHFIGTVCNGDRVRPFDPATDMAELAAAMARLPNLRLLVIDPIVSAVSGDSHKNAEVRRGLQPLVDLAQQVGVAVLGISHFTKGTAGREPTERVTGSLAFGALARLVMCTVKPAEDGAKRRLVRAKSNISPDGDGFEYDLVQKPLQEYPGVIGQAVCWGKVLEGSARALLAEVEAVPDDGDASALAKAETFLRNLLADAPMLAEEVKAAAREAGSRWATIRRAKEALGIVAVKRSMEGGWWWALPPDPPEDAHPAHEDVQRETMSTFGKNEHLRRRSSPSKMLIENGGKPEGAHPQGVGHLREHLRCEEGSEEGSAWEATL